MGNKFKVCISYVSEDREIAQQLHDDLKSENMNAWLDAEEILPGQNWKRVIKRAIKDSSFFIPLLSKNSVGKVGHFQSQLKYAIEQSEKYPPESIYMLPVRLDDCDPEYLDLGEIHCADLFPSYEEALPKILRALRQPEKSGKPTRSGRTRTFPFGKTVRKPFRPVLIGMICMIVLGLALFAFGIISGMPSPPDIREIRLSMAQVDKKQKRIQELITLLEQRTDGFGEKAMPDVETVPKPVTLAVVYDRQIVFDHRQKENFVAAAIMGSLSEFKQIELLERESFDVVLEELLLANSELVDPEFRIRPKLKMPELLLILQLNDSRPFVLMRLVETKSGKIHAVLIESFEKRNMAGQETRLTDNLTNRLKQIFPSRIDT